MKMCEQILKKIAPQYNSNSLNSKKYDVPNNSRYRFAAIKKKKNAEINLPNFLSIFSVSKTVLI